LARKGPKKQMQYAIKAKYVYLPTPTRSIKCLQMRIMKNAPNPEKKIAFPIRPSVIPIFSAMCGIYVTQVLNIKLKQAYRNAEAKYFLFRKKNFTEIIPVQNQMWEINIC